MLTAPDSRTTRRETLSRLADLLRDRRLVVLTGAGCSTESGIPDYRGTGKRQRTPMPIRYQEFVRSAEARRRMAGARPNPGHDALARLEREGLVRGVITQNVDGLHQAAGSVRVIELHGTLSRVLCLACGSGEGRAELQERLVALNSGWLERHGASPARGGDPYRDGGSDLRPGDSDLRPDGDAVLRPDGDAELRPDGHADFRLPGCRRCGGVLKPDVVFFGENVPRDRLGEAWRVFEEGDVLLVAGSSLTVYSGYRFVRRAAERDLPVAIVNVGETRGDGLARLRVEGRTGEVLPRVAEALLAGGAPASA
jgi:NAD-dependent deacetylase sirtuin 4